MKLAFRYAITVTMIGLWMGAVGCSGGPEPPTMETIALAYAKGDFGRAYEDGAARAASRAEDAPMAAYLAGVSAGRLQDYTAAEMLLTQAARDGKRDLAADAYASLGLVYAEQDKLSEAADAFQRAAERYTGENRAKALFYAAIAQKLGMFDHAKDDLTAARAATTDATFRNEIDEQMSVVGFTIQIAAYRDPQSAQRDADRVAAKTDHLLKMGPPQSVPMTDPAGQPVTAVRVGRFKSHAAASQMLERLNEPTAIVVPVSEVSDER